MIKVITYGTYDLMHYGHIRLLERAKALGDYLIVGITSDDFDKQRGKINVQQSLMERIEAVRATGIADEIIVEEYEGQKIDDIRRMHIDIFTVGSDWVGKFDYLNEYCKVVYLERTEGVSSSDIRAQSGELSVGMSGEIELLDKFYRESKYVNGVTVKSISSKNVSALCPEVQALKNLKYEQMLKEVDAVYVASRPSEHYLQIKKAIEAGKHVLCESPVALSVKECNDLFSLAESKGVVLVDMIKTAYSTAYSRLLLAVKSGKIGQVVSVDATCTSLRKINLSDPDVLKSAWNSISYWGPTAMLPVFQILGTDCKTKHIASKMYESEHKFDAFTKIDFTYDNATATVKVGNGVKSEGELVVSGTNGYIYVPAPWWKTDYFEIRYENPADNKRCFYQLEGEGIRNAIVSFSRAVKSGEKTTEANKKLSGAISGVMQSYYAGENLTLI